MTVENARGVETVTLDGKRFVILPEAEYCRLTGEPPQPEMPAADAAGNYPAAEAMAVSLARDVLRARRRLGLTQAELARRAGIRPETVHRLETAKHVPNLATMTKIDQALKAAEGGIL